MLPWEILSKFEFNPPEASLPQQGNVDSSSTLPDLPCLLKISSSSHRAGKSIAGGTEGGVYTVPVRLASAR